MFVFGAGWLNLGSFVCGLVAWILPLVCLVRGRKNSMFLSAISISACAAAVCMQLFYASYLVKIEDWSALMDVSDTVAGVGLFLLVITVVLNAAVLAGKKIQTKKNPNFKIRT